MSIKQETPAVGAAGAQLNAFEALGSASVCYRESAGGSITFTEQEVRIYYGRRVGQLPQIAGAEWRGACPIHGGEGPNFTVEAATGRWTCHSKCGRGGDILELEMALTRAQFREAKATAFLLVGRAPEPVRESRTAERWPMFCTYDYRGEDGRTLFQVVRQEKATGPQREKRFRQGRRDRLRWRSATFEKHTGLLTDPVYGNRDVLAGFIEEARTRGLALIPWAERGLVIGYSGGRAKPKEVHPDWRNDGSTAFSRAGTNNSYWIAHTHPEGRQFLLELPRELAATKPGRY